MDPRGPGSDADAEADHGTASFVSFVSSLTLSSPGNTSAALLYEEGGDGAASAHDGVMEMSDAAGGSMQAEQREGMQAEQQQAQAQEGRDWSALVR